MEEQQPEEDVAPPETEEEPAADLVVQTRKSKRRVWLMLVLLLVASVIGFLILQRRQDATAAAPKPPPQPPGVAISTAIAQRGDIGVYINALGSVSPLATVTVKSWFTWPARFFSLGPTLTQTLFDKGRWRAATDVAFAQYDADATDDRNRAVE